MLTRKYEFLICSMQPRYLSDITISEKIKNKKFMNTFMGEMLISFSKGEAGMQVTSHLLMYVLEVRFLTPQ